MAEQIPAVADLVVLREGVVSCQAEIEGRWKELEGWLCNFLCFNLQTPAYSRVSVRGQVCIIHSIKANVSWLSCD